MSSDVVPTLLAWLQTHGCSDNLIEIQYLDRHKGHSVFAKQALTTGQVTLRIPYHLSMTLESAALSDLKPVVERHPELPADELLALHLMHERSKASCSFFAPFIASLPTTLELPVSWSETELRELEGTNVLVLTQLMQQQLKRDFETIHQAVMAEFPQLFSSLPTLKLEDYTWAMSVLWSRAFGITREGKYRRVLCPAMDMFNHDVKLCTPLDAFVSYEKETQMLLHHVPMNVAKGSALLISYGQYSNAKLLYSYGFIDLKNPRRAVDFWMKIPLNDSYRKLKQTLLDSHALTKDQTYDFGGTLSIHDVDERLLATLRVILMHKLEIQGYNKAFNQSILSVRNEMAVYETLQNACRRKLANFPSTLEEDKAILANTATKLSPRVSFAVTVRAEDKQVFTGVINTLEQWKKALDADPNTYPPSVTRNKQALEERKEA